MAIVPFGGRRRRGGRRKKCYKGGVAMPFGGRRRKHRGGVAMPFGGRRRRGGMIGATNPYLKSLAGEVIRTS